MFLVHIEWLLPKFALTTEGYYLSTTPFSLMHRTLLLLLSGAVACTHVDKKTMVDTATATTDSTALSIDQEVVIFNSDTLVVDRKAAVFYQPDSLQMEKRAKKVGEDFRIGADDDMYLMHLSYEFAESKKLSILDIKGPKFLKFVYADKSHSFVKLDTLPALWGVYFFEPTKKPKEIDIANIEDEYDAYFK